MKNKKNVMPKRSKTIEEGKCPRCRRDSLRITKIYRLNYPYGHTERGVPTLIKTTEECGNKRCNYFSTRRGLK